MNTPMALIPAGGFTLKFWKHPKILGPAVGSNNFFAQQKNVPVMFRVLFISKCVILCTTLKFNYINMYFKFFRFSSIWGDIKLVSLLKIVKNNIVYILWLICTRKCSLCGKFNFIVDWMQSQHFLYQR